ncbi:T9SS type A sorting domain-containing protein [Hymenobacter sp. 15J16-1T3B]|uniref:T9SS type A sorting domain-containing protein n=1 Tax=Hymenobacter sp. 15J16-1T3B TaxID=2886941 RepID=UPI001D121708|nr:T9SS type A sorting domain-containing protein [Hymenobacter sp. 15J16-1T3B]MCC3157679.1 T9SS type A sorting domain-containing protein [Hymenobacter sp. 15J16-1T3B]
MLHFLPLKRHAKALLSLTALAALPLVSAQAQLVNTYTMVASTGTFTPLPASATSPALSGGDQNDGFYNNIPLGFTFKFDGVNYTTVSASTNGWLTFGQNITDSTPANNLTSGTPRPIAAPLWDDISFVYAGTGTPTGNLTGSLLYSTTGTAPNRTFTVEWRDARWAPGAAGPVQSFQIQMDETSNEMRFVYVQGTGTVSGTRTASVGLAGRAANNFLSLNSLSNTAAVSTSTETVDISARASSNRVFTFTPGTATATKNAAKLAPLAIYPNPARELVQVQGAGKGQSVELLDLQGRVVRTLPAGATSLNVSDVKSGMYLVRSGAQQARIVVQ